jgi:hypothetical protein
MLPQLVFVAAVSGAFVGYLASSRRGFSSAFGALAGAVLGPLSPLLFFMGPDHKDCPACQESVKPDAKVCKHCGHKFAPPVPANA